MKKAPGESALLKDLNTALIISDYFLYFNGGRMLSNEELVLRIKQGDQAAKAELITKNEGLVVFMVKRLQSLGEFDDLKQEAYIALLVAADCFDPDKGASFVSYATDRIFYHIIRTTHGFIRIPEYMKLNVYRYRRFLKLCEKEGIVPSDDEIAGALFVTVDEVEKIRIAAECMNTVSLQSLAADSEEITLQDTIRSPQSVENEVVEDVYAEELKSALWGEVDALEKSQSETIRARYIEGKTVAECIRSGNPHARQDEQKALRKLRESKRLKPFYEDLRSAGMKGTGLRRFRETGLSATERTALRELGEL